MNKINKKLTDANNWLLHKYPFFGEFFLNINIYKDNKFPHIAGVYTSIKGMNLIYNSNKLEKLTEKEVKFLILHEIYHLLFNHSQRTTYHDKNFANISQDMIINELILKDFSQDTSMIKNAYRIPKNYKDIWVFEKLYEFLKNQCQNNSSFVKKYGKLVDKHLEDEVSQEMKKQIVDEVIQGIKARGIDVGQKEFENALSTLRKQKKNYLKEIKSSLEHIIGLYKHKTWSKPNRKFPNLIKGFKKYSQKLNIVLDTSGSMMGYEEKIISYIYGHSIICNLIMIDTEIYHHGDIKTKSQFKKLKIKGGGGTILQPAINLIFEKYNKYSTIILTDGYTDELQLNQLNKNCLILSCSKNCPISSKPKGKFKQIIIEEKYE